MQAIKIANFVIILSKPLFMLQIYSRLTIPITIIVPLLLTSCQNSQHPIPNVPVNVIINLDLPNYQQLNAPGGHAYVNGGSRGIVVYRNFNEFVALDRHSTYNHTDDCAIVFVDTLNPFQLLDTCSGSRYNIMNGIVEEGPAQYGLVRYNSNWDGASTVTIYN